MKYVVLGSSAAGINGARELRRLDSEAEIVLISSDWEIYSRCILHHYLGGERDVKRLSFVEPDFVKRCRIQWMRGRTCAGLDAGEHRVILEDDEEVSYDKLLIATGAHTHIPPIEHLEGAGNVCGFRNIMDIRRLKEAAWKSKHILVMGGGLAGLECAAGFLKLGIKVTLVEKGEWLLNRQLDREAAKTYQDAFAANGVIQYYGAEIREVETDRPGRICGAALTDGRRIPCDYLVVTAEARPNVEFLEGSGIEIGPKGLVYDETGRTSDDCVYGAGDVSGTNLIWPVAVKEGIIAAASMAGKKGRMTDFFASKATMNFLGIPSMSLGNVNPAEGEGRIEILKNKDSYKKIVHKNGKIIGAVLQGDLAYGGILQQLIAKKIDITKVKKPVFDINYSDFLHMAEDFEDF